MRRTEAGNLSRSGRQASGVHVPLVRRAGASSDSQGWNDATVAPADGDTTPPHPRHADHDACGPCTDEQTCLAPVRPGSVHVCNLGEIPRRDGNPAEHDALVAARLRRLGEHRGRVARHRCRRRRGKSGSRSKAGESSDGYQQCGAHVSPTCPRRCQVRRRATTRGTAPPTGAGPGRAASRHVGSRAPAPRASASAAARGP